MSVDIFGQSANTEELMKLAMKFNLKVISDSAQAPGALRNGRYAGTLTHVGGFSLNYHKHIHTGEGGILVTDDDNLAQRARLIRNHAESVVEEAGITDLNNMVGFNFRMTEIDAAIGLCQLNKLEKIVKRRQYEANYLNVRLSKLPGLIIPNVEEGNTHVYYNYALQLNRNIIKDKKSQIIEKLSKAGLPNISGRYPVIYFLPIFQNKIAFGKSGFPWNNNDEISKVSYQKGICPVAEDLLENTLIQFYINDFDLSDENLDFIASKFEEVWQTLSILD